MFWLELLQMFSWNVCQALGRDTVNHMSVKNRHNYETYENENSSKTIK